MNWIKDERGRYFIEGHESRFGSAPYIYTAEYGYTVEGRKTKPKGFSGYTKASLTRAKKYAEREFTTKYITSNSGSRGRERNCVDEHGQIERDKWIPAHAVRFNKDGSVSMLR
jgi:hypothetical protein